MLIILAPYAYYVCCCDPVNSELENREEIVAVIVNAFNLFLTSLPKPPEIPNNIEIVQPKVSNYDFNYFENLYLNFTNILYINCLAFYLNISVHTNQTMWHVNTM